jgi:hypothetical protein
MTKRDQFLCWNSRTKMTTDSYVQGTKKISRCSRSPVHGLQHPWTFALPIIPAYRQHCQIRADCARERIPLPLPFSIGRTCLRGREHHKPAHDALQFKSQSLRSINTPRILRGCFPLYAAESQAMRGQIEGMQDGSGNSNHDFSA